MSTRDELLKITLKEVAKRGIDGVSLSDIARRVNIKPSSIYAFFESKDALIKESILMGGESKTAPPINIDFNKDLKDVLLDLYSHYIDEYSDGVKRDYFVVLSKESFTNKEIYKMYENLLYSIESQINLILSLKLSNVDKESEKILALSNVLSYAFVRIMLSAINEGKESAIWDAEDLITSLLCS